MPPPLAVESLDAGTCGVHPLQTPQGHAAAQAAWLSPRTLPPGRGPPSWRPWVCQPPMHVRGPQEPWHSSRGLCLEGADQPGQLLHRPGRGHGEVRVGPRAGDGGWGPSPLHPGTARAGLQSQGLRPARWAVGAVPRVSLATTLSPGGLGRQVGKGQPHHDHKTGHSGQCWAPLGPQGTSPQYPEGASPQGCLWRVVMGSCIPRTLPENLRAPRTLLGEGGGGPQAWIPRARGGGIYPQGVVALNK